MKPEHSKMEYVRLTMEEYQLLIDENKKLKELLKKATEHIYRMADLAGYCNDCEYHEDNSCVPDDIVSCYKWKYEDRVKELLND